MFRTTLTFIAILLVSLFGYQALAQSREGRWTVYPNAGDRYTDIIETSDRVYALSAGTLMHQSFDDNEFYVYGTARLSDRTKIRMIRYNYDKKYLLIVYENNNMDMLYDNDTVVNLPEIRDASVTSSRTINGISFHDGRIYVAADFGLVVYDDTRHEVIESGIYNRQLTHAFVLGDRLVVRAGTEEDGNNLYYAPVGGRHNQWNVFTPIGTINFWVGITETIPLSDNKILFYCYRYGLSFLDLDFESNTSKFRTVPGFPYTANCYIHPTAEGGIVFNGGKAYFFRYGSEEFDVRTLPEEIEDAYAPSNSWSSVWLTNDKNACRYDLSATEPTVLMTMSMPEAFSVDEPCQMMYASDGSLYVANITVNNIYQTPGDNFEGLAYMDRVGTDGRIVDAACLHADKVDNSKYVSFRNKYDRSTGRIMAAGRFVPDPDDPQLYYIADNEYGLTVIKDNEIVEIFDSRNSYTRGPGSTRCLYTNIDYDGNLWMGTGYVETEDERQTVSAVAVLPASKRRGDLSEVKKEDWVRVPEFMPDGASREVKGLFSKKYPEYSVFTDGRSVGALYFRKNNGTPLNFNDDRIISYTSYTDREGNPFTAYYITSLTEDADGKIWVGTDFGPFVIDDIRTVFDPDFRIRRPIVARNDGTSLGDYLLDGEKIFGVAVDPSNRKWIATETSGVYLVNSTGTKILAHYTSANSPLPSDCVESLAADPNSNRVWFGTTQGIVCYESDSAPAADDYSDVYAYPNPVRPEYTGWITVVGLMDNSLVKIADAAGNVVFQGTSEGGMISWDGCGRDGQRVRSGIYFVFASQNASSGSSGAVTKIMVVN